MCSYISGGWVVGVPDVVFHKNAVEAVIAAPKPTRLNHPPCSVSDDLSHTDAVVFEMPRQLILISLLVTGVLSGDVGVGYVRGSTIPLTLGASDFAFSSASFMSAEFTAIVVLRSVTPPPAAATASTASIAFSSGASAMVRKSYSPNVM